MVTPLYEWNIDGLLEQEIINKMGHMSMVANAYITNHNVDHVEIVNLLTTGVKTTGNRYLIFAMA